MLFHEVMHQDYPSMMANRLLCTYDIFKIFLYCILSIISDDELTTAVPSRSDRTIITPRFEIRNTFAFSLNSFSLLFSEAARRIAASGIPILSRSQTEPSISRELSIRRTMPTLDRVPSRTIRPPPLPRTQPRIPISQLPRIQRRT